MKVFMLAILKWFWENILNTNVFTALVTSVAIFFAYKLGKRQNEINEKIFDIQNFVDTFVMPQVIISKDENGKESIKGWNLLVKNASSYPIYLNRYSLNGVATMIGNTCIPTGSDAWYGVSIPLDLCKEGAKLSFDIEFEDYLGNKYSSKHYGVFKNPFWEITSEKRIKIT